MTGQEPRLLMISAMYENGGNTTQRLLDGHPELYSYPFESQLGTRYVQDHLTSLYPVKYRWPVFPLHSEVAEDYETIIDEECKVRIKTPASSKFRDTALAMEDKQRKQLFLEAMRGRPRTRASLVKAFFQASAEAWTDYARSGRERMYVGYSPIVGVDADKIAADGVFVLNVIRSPFSAYADTKKRPVPLAMAHYLTGWSVHALSALAFEARFPEQVFVLRYEDIVTDPVGVLSSFLSRCGIGPSPTLAAPSWNARPLAEVYPWGTIRTPTPAANLATARELSREETEEIRLRTAPLLAAFRYEAL